MDFDDGGAMDEPDFDDGGAMPDFNATAYAEDLSSDAESSSGRTDGLLTSPAFVKTNEYIGQFIPGFSLTRLHLNPKYPQFSWTTHGALTLPVVQAAFAIAHAASAPDVLLWIFHNLHCEKRVEAYMLEHPLVDPTDEHAADAAADRALWNSAYMDEIAILHEPRQPRAKAPPHKKRRHR